MIRTFINRKQELGFLEEKYKQDIFQFVVLYGRRRVGKTELVRKFIQDKPALYFLADKRGTAFNVERFKDKVAEFLHEPKVQLETFEQIFAYLHSKVGSKRVVVAIDEFPYLIEKDDAIPSIFQLCIDEGLQKSNFFLILLGSSVAMMEEGVLSRKSPLYGRRTGQLKIKPLSFKDALSFMPGFDFSDAVKLYGLFGGIPFYLVKIDEQKTVLENIEENILKKGEVLSEEVDFLLKEELRDPSTYKSILEAMAKGATKTGEIADKAKVKVQDVDKYIKTLMVLGYIERITPITEGPSSKKSIYHIKDPFFRFWFTFCFPYLSDLELENTAKVSKIIEAQLPTYTGPVFEEVCRQLIPKKVEFQTIGKWWGFYRKEKRRQEIEIDLVAIDDDKKRILFGECKWQENVDPEKVLAELKEKASYVEWNKIDRTEQYVLFAKSFKDKRKINQNNVHLYDLQDIQRIANQNS